MLGLIAKVGPLPKRGETGDEPLPLGAQRHELRHPGGIRGPVAVWTVGRDPGQVNVAHAPGGGSSIVSCGNPLLQDSDSHRFDAERALRVYQERGLQVLAESLDGSFVLGILDHRAGFLHILNDRSGSVPVHFRAREGGFAVAPTGRALLSLLKMEPSWDAIGAATFLHRGFAIGERTLLGEVRLLPPAHLLSWDFATSSLARSAYWCPRFHSHATIGRSEASDALHSALTAGHRAVSEVLPKTSQLLLTGGYDSRLVLANLHAIGRPPAECVTWGATRELEGSDPTVAEAMSRHAGVPWRFIRYSGADFAKHALDWAQAGELESDNMGPFAAGPDWLSRHGSVGGALLVGDHLLGEGRLPLSMEDALVEGTGIPDTGIDGALATMMGKRGQEAAALILAERDELVSHNPNDSPKGLKDFLTYRVGLGRWLNASTPFREPFVTTCRPLLMKPALDVVLELPENLRVDKTLLVSVLKRHHPEWARFPDAKTNSLIDWHHTFSNPGPSRDLLQGALSRERLEALPISMWLDLDEVERARDRFLFSNRPLRSRTGGVKGYITDARRAFSRNSTMSRVTATVERRLRGSRRRIYGPSMERALIRLALLSMLNTLMETDLFLEGSTSGARQLLLGKVRA
jgi:hypothetical protein